MSDAFFTLHRDLPREGPGEVADVIWTAQAADLAPDAHVADVACGPGADLVTWADRVPQGFVTGFDRQAHFVEAARDRVAGRDRVAVHQGDMAKLAGQFDLIWCAGAVYFLGLRRALSLWRRHVQPGGHIAVTAPCHFAARPSDRARAFWAGDEALSLPQLAVTIGMAGFQLVAQRRLSDAAWEAYYQPLLARAARLKPDADPALLQVIAEAEEEAAAWSALRAEVGYTLCLMRPA